MKQVNIQFAYDDERLEALRIYLAESGSTIEDELTAALDAVYKKTVTSQVRAFLDKRSQTEPPKPKSKPSGAGVNASKGTDDKSSAPEAKAVHGAF